MVMKESDGFHERLIALTSDSVMTAQELLSGKKATRREEKPSDGLVQGDLFSVGGDANVSQPPKKKPYEPPVESKPKPTEGAKRVAQPPPLRNYTYADHLKIHCGNRSAANYWYEREQKRFR